MPEFIPGLQLSEIFYWEAVRPILDAHFPGLAHSAALLGYGSEVQGFDTPVSRDHNWGPRLFLFLQPAEYAARRDAVDDALRQHLPARIRGYSTNFSDPDPQDNGTQVSDAIESGPVNHLVVINTLPGHFQAALGVDLSQDLLPEDWLTLSEQVLIEQTAGKVFHDDLGLAGIRARLAYYPQDVWLYLLASQWSLIAQEEAFIGRTWQAGDVLGSRVVTARMVERLMRLCFLMEKRYAPYSKWFGTAFKQLACYPQMGPLLESILDAYNYPQREPLIARAYSQAAEMHNRLGITPPVETRTRTYSGWHALRDGIENLPLDHPGNTRPHLVIFGDRFVDAIYESIRDPHVLALRRAFGSTSQFLAESSNAVQDTNFRRSLKDLL